jgi:hypothetical protein
MISVCRLNCAHHGRWAFDLSHARRVRYDMLGTLNGIHSETWGRSNTCGEASLTESQGCYS